MIRPIFVPFIPRARWGTGTSVTPRGRQHRIERFVVVVHIVAIVEAKEALAANDCRLRRKMLRGNSLARSHSACVDLCDATSVVLPLLRLEWLVPHTKGLLCLARLCHSAIREPFILFFWRIPCGCILIPSTALAKALAISGARSENSPLARLLCGFCSSSWWSSSQFSP